MKKDDLTLLFSIIVFTVIISFFIGSAVIGEPESKPVKVDSAVSISNSFPAADNKSFSENSIDPTVNISIGNAPNNKTPFNTKSGE